MARLAGPDFDEFAEFLKEKQELIVDELEDMEGEDGATFSKDPWGCFLTDDAAGSGGITRVIQGGASSTGWWRESTMVGLLENQRVSPCG